MAGGSPRSPAPPAEKARRITIDLGFAYRRVADADTLGFVDVPSHEDFIHNMLAGRPDA